MKNTITFCIVVVFILVSLTGCWYEKTNDANFTDRFFQFERAANLNRRVVQAPSDYSYEDFRKMREDFGMIPFELKHRVGKYMGVVQGELSSHEIDELIQIGHPVWNRARIQHNYDKGELMLVPLVQKDSYVTEGILVFAIQQDRLINWNARTRDDLMSPMLEARPVINRREYIDLLTIAGFDQYLFDRQLLPYKYTLDPYAKDYEKEFNSHEIDFRDPSLIHSYFVMDCYMLSVDSDGLTDHHLCCRYICETFYIVDEIRGIVTNPGDNSPPNPGNSGGGNNNGNSGSTSTSGRDGLQGNGLCEWLWPVMGIYSGSSPLADLATVIGDNPQLCYLHVGALGTIRCDWSSRWDLKGSDCTSQVIRVRDTGSSVAGPKNGDMGVYVYARYLVENMGDRGFGVSATAKGVVGVSYEWTIFDQDEHLNVSYTRHTSVTRGLQCYDACMEN